MLLELVGADSGTQYGKKRESKMSTGNLWKDREDAIVRSIMSGNNSCGTIQKAMADGKFEEFLREMVFPTLRVCSEEAAFLAKQRDEANSHAQALRFACESVVANMPVDQFPTVKNALKTALPGHPNLQ